MRELGRRRRRHPALRRQRQHFAALHVQNGFGRPQRNRLGKRLLRLLPSRQRRQRTAEQHPVIDIAGLG